MSNIAKINEVNPALIGTITKYLESFGNKLSTKHRNQFVEIASAFSLNPFLREIYGIPYGDNFNIIVGYEVYLKRAEMSGLLDGWQSGTIGKGDEMKGFVEIWRKDWSRPFRHEVPFKEYDQKNSMWKSKPETMIEKVAIAQGFRRCFPVELGGIPYTSDEMPTTPDPVIIKEDPPKQIKKSGTEAIKEKIEQKKEKIQEAEVVDVPKVSYITGSIALEISDALKKARITGAQFLETFGISRLGELRVTQIEDVMSWIEGETVVQEPTPADPPADPHFEAIEEDDDFPDPPSPK